MRREINFHVVKSARLTPTRTRIHHQTTSHKGRADQEEITPKKAPTATEQEKRVSSRSTRSSNLFENSRAKVILPQIEYRDDRLHNSPPQPFSPWPSEQRVSARINKPQSKDVCQSHRAPGVFPCPDDSLPEGPADRPQSDARRILVHSRRHLVLDDTRR